jgi:hypothetical protein
LAILCTGTVIRDEVGLSLEKADNEVLGTAAKIVVTKDSTTIVGDGTTQEEVNKRVMQIKNQIEVCILEDFTVFLCYLSNHLHYLFRCGSVLFFKLLLGALILPDKIAFIFVAVTSLGDIAQVCSETF